MAGGSVSLWGIWELLEDSRGPHNYNPPLSVATTYLKKRWHCFCQPSLVVPWGKKKYAGLPSMSGTP